jgi:hypothetical protein
MQGVKTMQALRRPGAVTGTCLLMQPVVVQRAGASVDAEPTCVVCLERRPTMAVYPCGHRCLCAIDAPRFVGAACPICRGPATSVLAIFDA